MSIGDQKIAREIRLAVCRPSDTQSPLLADIHEGSETICFVFSNIEPFWLLIMLEPGVYYVFTWSFWIPIEDFTTDPISFFVEGVSDHCPPVDWLVIVSY